MGIGDVELPSLAMAHTVYPGILKLPMYRFILEVFLVAVPLLAFALYLCGLIKDRVSPEAPIPTAKIVDSAPVRRAIVRDESTDSY